MDNCALSILVLDCRVFLFRDGQSETHGQLTNIKTLKLSHLHRTFCSTLFFRSQKHRPYSGIKKAYFSVIMSENISEMQRVKIHFLLQVDNCYNSAIVFCCILLLFQSRSSSRKNGEVGWAMAPGVACLQDLLQRDAFGGIFKLEKGQKQEGNFLLDCGNRFCRLDRAPHDFEHHLWLQNCYSKSSFHLFSKISGPLITWKVVRHCVKTCFRNFSIWLTFSRWFFNARIFAMSQSSVKS